ncbi:MAG: hypothetical protein WA740_08485 [Candidatus Binataceae bacterium]
MRIILTVPIFLIFMLSSAVHAQQYHVDQGSSAALTKYLHRHRLPLVGAQVRRDDAGDPQVHLYGFVATDAGKADAERKAQRYLGVAGVPITNSIQINPSINSHGANAGADSSPDAANAPAQNSNSQWNNAMQGIYKNGAQPLPSNGSPGQP